MSAKDCSMNELCVDFKRMRNMVKNLKENSGQVIIEIHGGCVRYGGIVTRLNEGHFRHELHRACLGACDNNRLVYIAYRLEDEDIIIIDGTDFKKYLPYSEYVSNIHI
ncbi:MAG: hypothetical protein ABFQ53_03210 [Patescibacteria group bacterium]